MASSSTADAATAEAEELKNEANQTFKGALRLLAFTRIWPRLQEITKRAWCSARQQGQTYYVKRICPGALLSMPLLYAVAVCKLRRLSERSQPRGRIEWHRQRVHKHCVAVLRVLARMRCQRQRSALEQRVPA